jgi:hypothetical protein
MKHGDVINLLFEIDHILFAKLWMDLSTVHQEITFRGSMCLCLPVFVYSLFYETA